MQTNQNDIGNVSSDSILLFFAPFLPSVRNSTIYADRPTSLSPSILTRDSFRRDLLLSISNDFLHFIESMVKNLGSNAKLQKQKRKDLATILESRYKKVEFVNIIMSALGVFDNSSVDFFEMLKDFEFERKAGITWSIFLITSAIRTSCGIFCHIINDMDIPNSRHSKNFHSLLVALRLFLVGFCQSCRFCTKYLERFAVAY